MVLHHPGTGGPCRDRYGIDAGAESGIHLLHPAVGGRKPSYSAWQQISAPKPLAAPMV